MAGLKDRIRNKTADLKEMNSLGFNALHYAAQNLKLKVLKYLLESGFIPVDSVTQDEYGVTALHLVCLTNKPETVKAVRLLVNHKANVNFKDRTESQATPLFFAADRGNEAVVSYYSKTVRTPMRNMPILDQVSCIMPCLLVADQF